MICLGLIMEYWMWCGFYVSLLLLFIYHLDLALLPQHVGGQDAGKGGICQMSMTKAQTAFFGDISGMESCKEPLPH